jgi:polyisoprenoid-binding protein YceI
MWLAFWSIACTCNLLCADGTTVDDQIVVIVRPGASELSRQFMAKQLQPIKDLGDQLKLPLRIVDVTDGAPQGIHITPLVFFQNHLGRSIYQGRYTDINRMRSFLRTARRIPQSPKGLTKHDVPARSIGRATIAAPLKITDLAGDVPESMDNDQFQAEARAAILRGFKLFKPVATAQISRSDRLFYLDFYPWRSPDGQFAVSVALFSQFNCKLPVFEKSGDELAGKWEDQAVIWQRAALALESAVAKELAHTPGGDGFDAIPASTPTVSWESLGLQLPDRPIGTPTAATSSIALGRDWTLVPPNPDAAPALQFRFAPPLDHYAGEVLQLHGELHFESSLAMSGMRGKFEADPKSVTMGEPLLDETLQGPTILDVGRHPTSRFEISSARSSSTLAWGQQSDVVMTGVFHMKGKQVPLNAQATVEPLIGEHGKARLLMRGRFQLDLQHFGIKGPDGPAPATHTLVFDFEFAFSQKN